LTGSGGTIGDLLVLHPKTRFIAFTGSKDVGLRIIELAAKTQPGQKWIKRVVAEMGGKDAIVVDKEAISKPPHPESSQLPLATRDRNARRAPAPSSMKVSTTTSWRRSRKKPKNSTVGPAEDPKYAMGPVINENAKKSILDYIEVGKKEGRLVTGGSKAAGDGYYIQPTIIADIEAKDRLFQEEVFGPVLGVTKARDFDHALELANDSEYGLTGAVYTKNPEKIQKARDQFFVGNLYINRKCTGAMVGAHPFGGFNMSGTDSKAGGPDYLLQFLQAKSIAEKIV
jgi:1-pyrroline-5-carboxylate dehydrogenase